MLNENTIEKLTKIIWWAKSHLTRTHEPQG